jgi:transposase
VPQMAGILRESEATVLRCLKRYLVEGMEGSQGGRRPGCPSEMSEAHRARLPAAVRRPPRRLALP